MEAPRRVCLMLALCSSAWCSLPALEPFCPEQCDCQQRQHIMCSNRGLRAVPRAPLIAPRDVLAYSLGGNFISNISASDFQGFGRLRRLDLQYNRLHTLHSWAFEQLPRLEELYLGHNLLASLGPGSLAPLRELRVLNANGNRLRELGTDAFAGLRSLTRLRLDGNALEHLPDGLFAPLTSLISLHLEGNHIRALGEHAFTGLAKLRLLDLSGNRHRALRHPAPFSPLRALGDLRLSANGLEQLSGGEGVFCVLRQLSRLWLSDNRLSQLEPGTFRGLGALRELRLDANRLSRAPHAVFDPLVGLEMLNLSHNALTSVHPMAFTRLTRLRELHLRDNALAVLSGEALAALARLTHLELDGDGWTCDCRLQALRSWLGAWHARGRLLDVFLRCHRPPALAGQYLDYLDESQLGANGSVACTADLPYALALANSTQPWVSTLSPPRKRLLAAPGLRKRGQYRAADALPSASALQLLATPRPQPTPTSPSLELPSQLSSFITTSAGARIPQMPPQERTETLQRAGSKTRPLVSDPCEFNRLFLTNLSVVATASSPGMATVSWQVAEHRSPRSAGPVHFRLLYERFGQPTRFQRFVYVRERGACSTTLHELCPGAPYLVCIESVIGGHACPVAPREHCAGLVVPTEGREGGEGGGAGEPARDYQLLTICLLTLNLLLVLLALAGWGCRRLRRRWSRRKAPAHVRHMYSTRRPYRSVGTGVSADFSGFQPHRPRPAAVCALSEADLMEFPCERFQDTHLRRDDVLQQRFTD
ncbi:TLR4 interactor with leucine rich repeats [Rhinatrema bivittatum]|uniref:TLR4 interactor with leucine rich repeats n=1 Tax=Rhinatrema bivittatum TaxID=194408 RepID=UPI00112BB0EF|nr:TLR4 interactor with leucine rich repeats [Rhinatrema bivittatum]